MIDISTNIENVLYLISASIFIIGLKRLSSPATARNGNRLSALGMLIAIIATTLKYTDVNIEWIILGLLIGAIIGSILAKYVEMTAMPQLVALFNAFGGAASGLVAMYEVLYSTNPSSEIFTLAAVSFATIVGAVTLTGSFIAFGKLQGIVTTKPVLLPIRNVINSIIAIAMIVIAIMMCVTEIDTSNYLYALVGLSLLFGILIVIPIGGADMPVVVALLNSYSGIAGAGAGFVLGNPLLIIAGSLVGASGLILTRIMTKAMNRSLVNVVLGGFGATATNIDSETSDKNYKSGSSDDIASLLEYSENIIIIPGYGLAVAQAQHSLKELLDVLENQQKNVLFAIHPVAGRMPGHMNVLLAEANIDYELLLDLDQVNEKFSQTDVSIVIGANDVVNPAAKLDKNSPIYGMPILEVEKSKSIVVLKRSMNPGFAGLDNNIFYNEKTLMLFGDAKDSIDSLNKSFKELN